MVNLVVHKADTQEVRNYIKDNLKLDVISTYNGGLEISLILEEETIQRVRIDQYIISTESNGNFIDSRLNLSTTKLIC